MLSPYEGAVRIGEVVVGVGAFVVTGLSGAPDFVNWLLEGALVGGIGFAVFMAAIKVFRMVQKTNTELLAAQQKLIDGLIERRIEDADSQ